MITNTGTPPDEKPFPVKPGDWVMSRHGDPSVALVKQVYRIESEDKTLVDLVLYDRGGDRIGRASPAMGGPRTFEPACEYEGNWCGHTGISRKNESQGKTLATRRWQCQKCTASFTVTVNTIFHHTHIDLQRWFLLISLMLSAKKGLSACQAARDLEMRRPTVHEMMHKVRAAMGKDGEAELLSGLIEIDEAYIGGTPRKPNDRDDDPSDTPRGRGTSKQAVVGAVDR